MPKVIRIRKGLNIKLKGKAEPVLGITPEPVRFGVKPVDFAGVVPKLMVQSGDTLKAGSPLFHDKYHPEILFPSPVSGIIKNIVRGERRRILEIEIESDGKYEQILFSAEEISPDNRESVKKTLLKSGLWPFIFQRPFGIIANPADVPDAIFLSGFDSAPLAPDYDFILSGEMDVLQKGIDVLSMLTDGEIYLGLRPGSKLSFLKGVEINYFDGPHPSGNVGIQINKIRPLNKGDRAWTLSLTSLVHIGRFFTSGKLKFEKIIAITGPLVNDPKYYKTMPGASVKTLLGGKTETEKQKRIISGNVLTGKNIGHDGYLGFYDHQVTVIPEGNDVEPFGWATPGLDKFSAGNTFFAKLFPAKEYVLNANLHGAERPFVVSGQYEKFLPIDILPVYLLKAILANDIDKMEQLGIYEVIEEDLALCEYACTSKIEVQEIIRKGINTIIKELA